MRKKSLVALIDKYLAGNASKEELDMLQAYYDSFQQNQLWNVQELGDKADTRLKIFERIKEGMKSLNPEVSLDAAEKPDIKKELPLRSKSNVYWFSRVAVAASVSGILLLGYNLLTVSHHERESIKRVVQNTRLTNDVPPGDDKAILTLADGSRIILDDANEETLPQQGSSKVIKLRGKLSYNPTDTHSSAVTFNTITTPRGGQYQIELPDGSQVWLNAASSLRFPTSFIGKQRRVELSGEAYFEVAKNKTVPFIVSVDSSEVQVLGTHFNVMAYREEAAVQTTLLEGSVKFVSGHHTSLLRPNEQLQMTSDGKFKMLADVDLDQVVAWKNGLFVFDNLDLETIMRQLGRWYDVEVMYRSKNSKQLFVGEIPRSSKLSDVLKVLELTGNLHFKIEDKMIVVL